MQHAGSGLWARTRLRLPEQLSHPFPSDLLHRRFRGTACPSLKLHERHRVLHTTLAASISNLEPTPGATTPAANSVRRTPDEPGLSWSGFISRFGGGITAGPTLLLSKDRNRHRCRFHGNARVGLCLHEHNVQLATVTMWCRWTGFCFLRISTSSDALTAICFGKFQKPQTAPQVQF